MMIHHHHQIEIDQGLLSILSVVLIGFGYSFGYAGVLLGILTLYRIFETCQTFKEKVEKKDTEDVPKVVDDVQDVVDPAEGEDEKKTLL